jgi:hypothetical protein
MKVFRRIFEGSRRMRPTMTYLKEESLAIESRMEYRLGQPRDGTVGVLVCGALLEVKQNSPR